MSRRVQKRFFISGLLILILPAVGRAVETANIQVGPLGGDPAVTLLDSSANFFLDAGAVSGEFPVRIGADASDDFMGGFLMTSAAENGRLVSGETIYATANVVPNFSSQSVGGGTLGGMSISTRRAGISPIGSVVGGGELMNTNFGAAYFPISQGWAGGTFSSSSVSGTGDDVAYGAMDQLNLNGLMSSNVEIEFFEPGYSKVTIPGVTDSRRQGLLFANVADNVGRYALAGPLSDGTGYTVATIDNDHFFVGDPDESNEDDGRLSPASFVFIPKGTPGVTMASMHGATVNDLATGTLEATPLLKSGDFTMTREAGGQYRLSIPGQTPSSGTLILTGGNSGSGGQGGRVADNVFTYQPDGNDWIILSQDPESNSAYTGEFDSPLVGNGQSNVNPEYYFQFAFLPHDGSVTGPGEIPDASSLTNLTKRSIIGWNAETVDYDGGNGDGSMGHVVVDGSDGYNIQALYDNRGDVAVAVDGGFLSTAEGVLFATIREGFRDNSALGGQLEYGVIGVSDDFSGPDWKIHTSIADPSNGEHNINYAAVYFGVDSGYEMAQKVQTETGILNDVTIPGVTDSLTEGALFVTPHGNDDNFVQVTPDGTGWDIRLTDNNTNPENDQVNYIFLPYTDENLVVGQVAPDGTVVNSTDPSEFSLSRELVDLPGDFDDTERPAYRLSIPGKTPEDGMLLLTSTGAVDGDLELQDNSVIYLADGDDFLILGLDHRATDDLEPFVVPADTGFYFAYVDFNLPTTDILSGDFDMDGDYDCADIDGLVAEISAGSNNASFDLTGDGLVDAGDLDAWLLEAGTNNIGAAFLEGDSNLDGVVDVGDFNVWNSNKFTATPAWCSGDFNADGVVDVGDFNIWNTNKFTSSSDAAAVPEPASLVLGFVGFVGLIMRSRKSRMVA